MSIQRSIGSGAAWMTVMMIVDRAIGFVSTLILARLLIPADFGIVAMCMSVIAGLQIFTAFGFDVVLIQKQDVGRDHYNTVFTLNVLSWVGVSLAIIATAHLTAAYFNEPRVTIPMMVIAVGFFVRAFENVKVVDFRKDMDFQKEAVLRVSQKVAGFCVTIPLAFYLKSYWALVYGMLAMNCFSVVISYTMKPYRPGFTLKYMREIFSFSAWLFLNNVLLFIETRFADFLVGSRLGAKSLGLLNMATDISATPATLLVAAANRAVYPGYAKLADDFPELIKTFLSVLCAISMLAVPIGLGIAAVAELIVPILLGNKWVEATPLLALLGVSSVVNALISNATYIFYTLAIPRQVTYFTLIYVGLLIPLTIYLVSVMGIVGAAWALLITSLVSLPTILAMVKRSLPIPPFAIIGSLWRSILSGAVMFLVVRLFLFQLQEELSGGLLLVLGILVGAVSYSLTLGLLVLTTGFRTLTEWQLLTEAYIMVRQKLSPRPTSE